MPSVYVEVLSDDCACKWVNYSDHEGWHLRGRNPKCPEHGDGNEEDGQ